MFRALFFVVIAVLLQGWVAEQSAQKRNVGFETAVDGTQIIGGENVVDREFPHLVSMQNKNGVHLCGASILNREWIVTAAHCISYATLTGIVKIGSNNNRLGSTHKIRAFNVHPQRRPEVSTQHDIALLKVIPMITFTTSVRPAKLPRPYQVTPAGSRATIAGWGNISREGHTSPHLYKLDVTVLDLQVCERAYQDYGFRPMVHNTNICAGTAHDMKAACHGDSGGSLMANGEIIGTVSLGSTICAFASFPTVYTEVAQYIPWIESVIEKQLKVKNNGDL